MVHEARQLLELAPKAIELIRGTIDRKRLVDLDAVACRDRGRSMALAVGAETERPVNRTMPGCAAVDQAAAHERESCPAQRPPVEAVDCQRGTRDNGRQALDLPDIDLSIAEKRNGRLLGPWTSVRGCKR